MTKHLGSLILIVFTTISSLASHITGGEISYEYLRQLPNGDYQYKIEVRLLRDALNSEIGFSNKISVGLYLDNKNLSDIIPLNLVSQYEITSKCQDKTNRDTRPIIGLYQRVIVVKPYSGNYILSFAQCRRNNSVNLSNINDMPSQGINLRAEFSTQYINSTPVNQIYRYLNQGILTNWYLESYDK